MTREELIKMAREAGFGIDQGIGALRINGYADDIDRFAEMVACAERKKHQADIERWKGEAAKAEKWRALALSKDPAAAGRIVQEIQREAAEHEREACINALATVEIGIFGDYDVARGIEECIEILSERSNP